MKPSSWMLILHIRSHMMHHAIPWGTALCVATLRPPEVKSCQIIWCIVQREHIVENRCDVLGFKCFQRLLSMQFIQNKSFWTFYCAFYKDILHFLNQNTAPKNKINNFKNKMEDVYFVPRGMVYVIICCFAECALGWFSGHANKALGQWQIGQVQWAANKTLDQERQFNISKLCACLMNLLRPHLVNQLIERGLGIGSEQLVSVLHTRLSWLWVYFLKGN